MKGPERAEGRAEGRRGRRQQKPQIAPHEIRREGGQGHPQDRPGREAVVVWADQCEWDRKQNPRPGWIEGVEAVERRKLSEVHRRVDIGLRVGVDVVERRVENERPHGPDSRTENDEDAREPIPVPLPQIPHVRLVCNRSATRLEDRRALPETPHRGNVCIQIR